MSAQVISLHSRRSAHQRARTAGLVLAALDSRLAAAEEAFARAVAAREQYRFGTAGWTREHSKICEAFDRIDGFRVARAKLVEVAGG